MLTKTPCYRFTIELHDTFEIVWKTSISAMFRCLTGRYSGFQLIFQPYFYLAKAEIEALYAEGAISPAALIAYAPARLAAELISLEDLKTFKIRTRSAVLHLNSPMKSGTYSCSELYSSTDKENLAYLVAGFEDCTVTVLEKFATYVRANVEPITSVNESVNEDIEFA